MQYPLDRSKPGKSVLTVRDETTLMIVFSLEVENAEDDLVQKTEVAIQLMKSVLENVSICLR